ncbi:MurR/RpiR family transcriptional regulator [uncultured Jannaschia sp.]|uniref:MurR/RpiR family transcriptional regulator n=1 Tax=uncultured Jannaschia sp. TaxID=293347 RepID=UPI00262B3C94|nr:MurR/RpiR family transcriptional regulator [uncultured Jannaschia sp.]
MTDESAGPPGPVTVTELIERIDAVAPGLPKRLRQCATFTRRHLHLLAVSTVADMARAAEVAPSVYIRFCQGLGFSGYSEMQALFRERYSEFRPDYSVRFANLREGASPDAAPGVDRLIADFAESGHKSLLRLRNTVTSSAADRIASDMAAARVVHLVGARRAFAIVANMAYLLDKMGVETQVRPAAGLIATQAALRPGDIVFAVTFAPFSQETLGFAREADAAGIVVHGLTDDESGPLAEVARALLVAREDEVAGFRAPTAAIALSTALCVAAGALRTET